MEARGATGAADRLRHRLRQPLARTPYLYDVMVGVRPSRRPQLASPDSAVVIEGFLRSGNTFSVAAFTVANGGDLHIGRHLHAAAHVLRAVRLGLPTVVLIRDPADAVVSYVLRRPTLRVEDALREYIGFYRAVWPQRHHFVTATFELATRDFGAVIRAVNDRFDTSFATFEHTPHNERAAFAIVEDMNRLECGGEVIETHVARPSANRQAPARAVRAALTQSRAAALLDTAGALRQEFLTVAAEASPSARRPRADS